MYRCSDFLLVFFFFQAEDGIRDADVTGVQTCALPISRDADRQGHDDLPERRPLERDRWPPGRDGPRSGGRTHHGRSEERRVGEEGRTRWGAGEEKKKERKRSKMRGVYRER